MGKGLFVIGLILAGIGVAITRAIRNTQSKMQGKRLLKLLDEDPRAGEDLASELLNVYASTPYNGQPLRSLMSALDEGVQLGKFQILRKFELGSGDYLVLTLCHNEDYDIGVNGKFKNVKNVTQYNFVVRVNRAKQLVEVCTDYHANLSDKFLRKEFGDSMVALIEKK